jgi:tetratricopeptide (TPR) repeat protein
LKKDSTFYDAYLAAGTFEYFWARAGRYLPILKLAGGDANEAMRKLRVAAEKSMYSGPTAENSLTFVYTEEGDYDQARRYADTLLARYPSSKTFMWNKAGLEFQDKNYAAAAESYQKLFQAYEPLDNYANLCQCKLFMGKCYYALQDRENARQALKDAINYRKYSDSYPPIKAYVREAYSILSKIL